jgi:hypothetical protein
VHKQYETSCEIDIVVEVAGLGTIGQGVEPEVQRAAIEREMVDMQGMEKTGTRCCRYMICYQNICNPW